MSPTILYARLPGLLTLAARQGKSTENSVPLAVVSGKTIRDSCSLAYQQGVRVGEASLRARRLCPLLLTVPLEEVDAHTYTSRFLEVLAALTPTIEPDGGDAVYADFAGGALPDINALSHYWQALGTGFSPCIGQGSSRLSARACAECGLAPTHLAQADVRWLFPEDVAVVARLQRLGLTTFEQVAAIGESALVYQFGKPGRLLHQRSLGRDFTPVRALWPLPQIEARGDYSLEPIQNEGYLRIALTDLVTFVSEEMREVGRFTRKLVLQIRTEQGTRELEWVLPTPAQDKNAVLMAIWRMYRQCSVRSPIIGMVVRAEDIVLPTSTMGNLFDNRAVERKMALAATRQKLRARYGIKSLRTLGEFSLPKREVRHGLWKARLKV